jgi:hypothetical protein
MKSGCSTATYHSFFAPYYGAGDDRFKFIGDCYLHGYMYGEKLREDPKLAEKIQPIVLV